LRVFLYPLGFHEHAAVRLLVEYRASRDDRLVVFTCSPLSAGSRSAFESLRAVAAAQGFPEPELVLVNCSDYFESFGVVKKYLARFDGEFVLEIGTGPRFISHVVTHVLMFLRRDFSVHYQPETGVDTPTGVSARFLEIVLNGLSSSEIEVLKALGADGASIAELARVLGKSEKTVRNIVSMLRSKGLVEKSGRSERVCLTRAGRALVA